MDLFSAKIAYASIGTFIAGLDNGIINPLIKFLFALAVIYFLYGVFEFLANQENDEKRTAGKSHMIWGIVGITIMLAVFAIMGMIVKTFNLNYISDPGTGAGQVNYP